MKMSIIFALLASGSTIAYANPSNGNYNCDDGNGYNIYLTVNKTDLLTYSDGTLTPPVMLIESSPGEYTGKNIAGIDIAIHASEADLSKSTFAIRASDANRQGDNLTCTLED